MFSGFNKRYTYRLVVISLQVVICLGLVDLSATASSAGDQKACGTSCPCDDASRDRQETTNSGHDAHPAVFEGGTDGESTNHQHPGPCNGQECPDNCTECGCCLGATVALAPAFECFPRQPGAIVTFSPDDGLTLGVCRAIFRPPRSLS